MSSKENESADLHDQDYGLHHQGGRVSIDQARKEIQRWKDHIRSLGEDCPYDFVQAFFIPMHDIKRLYEKYQHLDPTGVRAYIGITDKNEQGCAPLRLLLVPAKEHTDFYRHHKDDADELEDELGVNHAGDSSIYDFTMPCPDVCATNDPLSS